MTATPLPRPRKTRLSREEQKAARSQALLTAATQYVRDRGIDDPTWDRLRHHLDEAEAIELLLLCGQYDSLATTLLTLRVQPED